MIMATNAKTTNRIAKKATTTPKNGQVKEKLTKEAKEKTPEPIAPKKETIQTTPMVQLAERIDKFHQLQSLTQKHEKLNSTLSRLQKFSYKNDGNSMLFIRDASENEFKSTNNAFIDLATSNLIEILTERKREIEHQIMGFSL